MIHLFVNVFKEDNEKTGSKHQYEFFGDGWICHW